MSAEKRDHNAETEEADPGHSTPPVYSRFSGGQKRWIVALVAFAGWFSSLSSFIYFPAIPFLAKDRGTSIQNINLTATAYLIMSGIFPALVGSAADTFGRRPVFIITLAMYVGANLGLALQSSYGLLFFLRMVQSVGISGSYAITYGVIGDLFTPAERGGYSGIVSFILNTPPKHWPGFERFVASEMDLEEHLLVLVYCVPLLSYTHHRLPPGNFEANRHGWICCSKRDESAINLILAAAS